MDSTVSQTPPPETSGGRSAFVATLRDANYAKLLTAQVLAALGDRINQIAIISIIIDELKNTAKYSADILFWAILPSVVLGPFTLALVDRWNRQRTMIASDLARAILIASLPLLMICIHHYYVIYMVVFLVGTFTAIFNPCRLAILPNLVPSKLLMPANAISSQAGTIASVAVMPIGAFLVESLGKNTCFLINALTYGISAFLIWRLRVNSASDDSMKPHEAHHPVKELQAGLLYTWKTRPVLVYVVFYALIQFLVGIFFICFLSYVVDVLGFKVFGVTLFFVVLSFGMAAGALAIGRSSVEKGDYFLPMIAAAASGVVMLVLGRIHTPLLAGAALFGLGLCTVMILVPLDTFVQKHVPDHLRGRVFAARGVLWGALFLVSLQLSKGIINQLGTLPSLQLTGLAAVVIGLAGAWIGHRANSSWKGHQKNAIL